MFTFILLENDFLYSIHIWNISNFLIIFMLFYKGLYLKVVENMSFKINLWIFYCLKTLILLKNDNFIVNSFMAIEFAFSKRQ